MDWDGDEASMLVLVCATLMVVGAMVEVEKDSERRGRRAAGTRWSSCGLDCGLGIARTCVRRAERMVSVCMVRKARWYGQSEVKVV
jgi:hypothetical protein